MSRCRSKSGPAQFMELPTSTDNIGAQPSLDASAVFVIQLSEHEARKANILAAFRKNLGPSSNIYRPEQLLVDEERFADLALSGEQVRLRIFCVECGRLFISRRCITRLRGFEEMS